MDEDEKQKEETTEPEVEIIPDPEPKQEEAEEPGVEASEDQKEEAQEQPKRGKRAERRIRSLVRDKNTLTSALGTAAEQLEAVRAENERLTSALKQNRTSTADEIKRRLDEEEKRLKTSHALAVEQEDQEALFDIRGRQGEIAAEKVALRTLQQEELADAVLPTEEPVPPAAPVPAAQARVAPDGAAQEWQEANPWFGNVETTDARIKSAGALMIHQDLVTEGFDPSEAATGGNTHNEYYMELDKRIASQFSGETKPKRGAPVTTVVGGTRAPTTGPKTKTRLTQSEYELTKRLGIDPVAYAREKALKAAGN